MNIPMGQNRLRLRQKPLQCSGDYIEYCSLGSTELVVTHTARLS